MNTEEKNISMKDVLDVLLIEKGRLALIDSISSSLSEDEKTIVLDLVATQKGNIEHAFNLYREFQPLVSMIDSTGKELVPYIDTFLSSGVSSSIVETEGNSYNINPEFFVEEGPVMETSITESPDLTAGSETMTNETSENVTEENSVVETAEITEEATASVDVDAENSIDTAVVDSAASEEVPVSNDGVIENNAEVAAEETSDLTAGLTLSSDVGSDSGAQMVPEPVSAETGVVTGSEVVTIPGNEPQNEAALPVVNEADVPSTELDNVSNEEEANVDLAEFVLSPIDEGVITSPVEKQEAGESVDASEKQLQASDDIKNEIVTDTNLSDDEKQAALEKYTRATENMVKAILVTKTQYEKLLVSRDTQKALMNSKNSTNGNDVVVPLATETSDASQVVLPTIAPPSDVVLPSVDSASQVVLPTIATDTNSNPTGELNSVIALPSVDSTVDSAKSKQQQLQMMMEQANNLYKEGKTQEAQALFNQISAINQELQSSQTLDGGENVLVKKIEGV